ncbi:MAG: type II toxin-antitoxin system VapC family toxin [Gemmataceae bacterium]|nr:type II toxin-antitoxin system VapC family toxin [Gemmataceae bacterium]
MTDAVLDASALLALLRKEPGADRVQGTLGGACISAVNLSEVIAKLMEYGKRLEESVFHMDRLQIPVIPFDAELAKIAASLRASTRAAGLSLGDCACLALALARKLPAVTAERAWEKCDVGVRIIRIR